MNLARGFDGHHHRNHFAPSVRAALGLLDRVEDGQDVSQADVMLALEVTGDAFAHSDEPGNKREYGRSRAFAAGKRGNWHEGPCSPREPHPRAEEQRP